MKTSSDNLSGVLVVDKPVGPTSHDVVSIVKRITCARRVGHLGTLDPGASGVLPLVINEATKRAGELAGDEKVYEFTLCLGRSTDTDDDRGETIEEEAAVPAGLMDELKLLIPRFVGRLMQTPPSYSAIKVSGRKAYDLKRDGIDPGLLPREVIIDSLEIIGWDWPCPRLRMSCRKGTYVRSLCRDLGRTLGCGGHAKDIRRLRSGPYIIDTAVSLDRLKREPEAWKSSLIM
ncbi:MAG: tRNA pseudouridine(55) synthase TruB [bacterium]